MMPIRRCQRGVSIIAAIFMLLLLASLAALMARMTSSSQASSAQDLLGSKAYQAARAGIEWGLYQLDPNAATATLPGCFAPTTLTQIDGFSVAVRCEAFPSAATTYDEGGRSIRVFRLTATGSNGAVPPQGVEREIVVTAEKCRDPAITSAPYDCTL